MNKTGLRGFFAACIALASVSVCRADMITTTFSSNNEFFGNMFDVTTFGNALNVTAFNVNILSDGSPGAPVPVSVYTRTGTYVGHDTSSAGWTLIGTITVTSQGQDHMTFVDTPDFQLSANALTGFYVTVVNNGSFPFPPPFMRYTDGANSYSDSHLRLDLGEGVGPLFGGLGTVSPRTWDGSIFYSAVGTTSSTPEPASISLLGLCLVAPMLALLRRKRVAQGKDHALRG